MRGLIFSKRSQFILITLYLIALSFLTLYFSGCGECRYDEDCSDNMICSDGVCTNLLSPPKGSSDKENSSNVFSPDGGENKGGSCLPGETRKCYSGLAGTEGVGLCRAGTQSCNDNGEWGPCKGEVLPLKEVCDGKDNDCDGLIDEGLDDLGSCTVSGKKGICQEGKKVCRGGGTEVCISINSPKQEVCDNNLDDDCDGQIDEYPPCSCKKGEQKKCYSGDRSTLNRGVCKEGVQYCINNTWGPCRGEVTPSQEVCDGKDNDCDGQTDEDLKRACSSSCGQGYRICQGGIWSDCQAPKPQKEVCDGKDNDCDGQIDNGLVRECSTRCGKGVEKCIYGRWSNCSAPQPQPEVCNGRDDDCDGMTDEFIRRSCSNRCGRGYQTCRGGTWSDCSAPKPQKEVCDGRDNDCDGQIDEESEPPKMLSFSLGSFISGFIGDGVSNIGIITWSYYRKEFSLIRIRPDGTQISSPHKYVMPASITSLRSYWDSFEYKIVWRSSSQELYLTRISSYGRLISTKKVASNVPYSFSLSYGLGYFFYLASSYNSSSKLYDITYAKVDRYGNFNVNPFVSFTLKNSPFYLTILYGYSPIAAWQEYSNKRYQLFMRVLFSNGRTKGIPFTVASNSYIRLLDAFTNGSAIILVFKEGSSSSSSNVYVRNLTPLSSKYFLTSSNVSNLKGYSYSRGFRRKLGVVWSEVVGSNVQIMWRKLSTTSGMPLGTSVLIEKFPKPRYLIFSPLYVLPTSSYLLILWRNGSNWFIKRFCSGY